MSAAESLRPEDSLWSYISVYLRKERQRRKLSQSEVGVVIQADKQRVANIEAGRLNLTSVQAELLDEAWGTMLVPLRGFAVVLGRDREWWKQLNDFERKAQVIKIYVAEYVPVPFQTEAYARALLTAVRVVGDVEAAVRNRMERTKMLLDELPRLSLWTLIDERALDPPIPLEHKREQLQVLLELMDRTSVRVVPDGSWHVGSDGNFELITTAAGVDVAYMWAQLGGRLVHDGAEVRNLALRYDRIGAVALSEESSRELVTKRLEHLR